MEHGEIIHDYNYAQVITLNLVRKGFRVQEVPITYKVRETGDSFISFQVYDACLSSDLERNDASSRESQD